MKTINILIIILLTYRFISAGTPPQAQSDTHSYTYRQATLADFDRLLHLINEKSSKEENLVTLPKKYRAGSLKGALEKGRLFVCCNGDEIIGYKKAFVLDELQEQAETLSGELCFETKPVAQGSFTLPDYTSLDASPEAIRKVSSSPTTYIYNGADFTDQLYRGKGVNSFLTRFALQTLSPQTAKNIKEHGSRYLALVYGLTKANAGKESDLLGGRTRGIVQEFVPFATKQAQETDKIVPSQLLSARHPAFKPSFDPDSEECIPSSQQVPGYGCVIACPLLPKESAAS